MSFTHSWFRHERLGIAARCCGAAERLIEEASAFAKDRESFGDKISNFQAVQFMLADSVNEDARSSDSEEASSSIGRPKPASLVDSERPGGLLM